MKTNRQCPDCGAYEVEYYDDRGLYQCLACAHSYHLRAPAANENVNIYKSPKEGDKIKIGDEIFVVGPAIKPGDTSSFGLFKKFAPESEEDDQPEPTNIPHGFNDNGEPRI